jgi:rubrerythrin
MGLMQVLNDPRTSFMESLHAIHIAELADVDAWNLLTALAEGVGEDDLAERFRAALLEETRHLQMVRGWHEALVLAS